MYPCIGYLGFVFQSCGLFDITKNDMFPSLHRHSEQKVIGLTIKVKHNFVDHGINLDTCGVGMPYSIRPTPFFAMPWHMPWHVVATGFGIGCLAYGSDRL